MQTPDERKDFLKRLQLAASEADYMLTSCDASDILDCLEKSRNYMVEAASIIEQLEATLNAAVKDMSNAGFLYENFCIICKFYYECKDQEIKEHNCWEWRGICEEE